MKNISSQSLSLSTKAEVEPKAEVDNDDLRLYQLKNLFSDINYSCPLIVSYRSFSENILKKWQMCGI